MSRPLPLSASVAWGAACGAALGALRTRNAALHLLAKNRALEEAGFVPLPGAGHWDTLASWLPGAAGALFFGLSLGLGAGILLGLWARSTRALPSAAGRIVPWAVLAVPLWALGAGDPGLAAALAAAAVGAVWSQGSTRPPETRAGLLRALVLAPLLTALLPWATASEGPFTRLRDRFLLTNPLGAAVNTFYYRWTLYPAEVLKPLAALSQPSAAVSREMPPEDRARFCRQGLRWGLLCVNDRAGADVEVVPGDPSLELVRGRDQAGWPKDPSAQGDAWKALSAASDQGGPLRRATYWALFLGGPLALCWGFSSLALYAGAVVGGRRRVLACLGTAGLLAASLGAAGLPDRSLDELRERLAAEPPDPGAVRAALGSSSAVVRFYGTRAAGPARVKTDLIADALSDPMINVRYAAAEALGRVGGAEARELLLEVVTSPEEWYVKERAYASLWRLGWRGR